MADGTGLLAAAAGNRGPPAGKPANGGRRVRITEIRLHGVADKGPETILDRPIVARVAGDDNAGFYRPRPGYGAAAGTQRGDA